MYFSLLYLSHRKLVHAFLMTLHAIQTNPVCGIPIKFHRKSVSVLQVVMHLKSYTLPFHHENHKYFAKNEEDSVDAPISYSYVPEMIKKAY